jgi:DHA1 family multidrug resistance protein-like MFS transporter
MVTPNLLSAVSLLSKENAGSNISLQTSANSVGQILGPVIGTWLIAGGFYYPFIIAGIIVLTAIGLLYFFKSFYKSTNENKRKLLTDH